MIPSTCPICNSILVEDPLDTLKCSNDSFAGFNHYSYSKKPKHDYSFFLNNNTIYRIYNNYDVNFSTIRINSSPFSDLTSSRFIHAEGVLIYKVRFTIPIKPNSIDRFLNLKMFI